MPLEQAPLIGMAGVASAKVYTTKMRPSLGHAGASECADIDFSAGNESDLRAVPLALILQG
jgi:hypothetical protein